MQSQLVCSGCRNILVYPRGASNVWCALCNAVASVPPPVSSQYAHINCGHCRTALMYPYGAPSVKCALCHFVINVNIANTRVPFPVNRPKGTSGTMPSTSTSMGSFQTQTVDVESPMSVDESGKLVSNVVVGVTTDKKYSNPVRMSIFLIWWEAIGTFTASQWEDGYGNYLCIFYLLEIEHKRKLWIYILMI